MKLAVIFHGLSSGTNDKGEAVSSLLAINSIKNSFSCQNADYFFHTWGEANDKITKLLKPKSYKFEASIQTKYTGSKIHSTISRFTSMQKSIKIFNEYRLHNNIDYHAAIIIRFDLLLYGKILPRKITEETIAFPIWGNYQGRKIGYLDYYFIIGKNHYENLHNVVDFVQTYINNRNITQEIDHELSNHIILKELIKTLKGNVTYSGREYKDFCLVKHYRGFSNESGKIYYIFSKQSFLYILSVLHIEYPIKAIYSVIKNMRI